MKKGLVRFGLAAIISVWLLTASVYAQIAKDTAAWQGGTGNFSNAGQWICSGLDFLQGPAQCVPNGPQFQLDMGNGGTLSIDTNVVVNSVVNALNLSLSLSGTSLTTASATNLASLTLTNGATVTVPIQLNTDNLMVQNSTVNANLGVGPLAGGGTANISGGTIQELGVFGTFTISNSTLGDNSVLVNMGQSSISGTSFNGDLDLSRSGSVVVDQGSKINSVVLGAPLPVIVGGFAGSSATLTIQGSSQLSISGEDLELGLLQGSTGAVVLNDTSTLSANNETIGDGGTGNFTQTGGKNTASAQVTLGAQAGSNGTYTLSGGQLSTDNAQVGVRGTGTFNQTGGTNTINKSLLVGVFAGGSGTYTLQNGGILTTGSDGSLENLSGVIGVQSGGQGTVTVTGDNSEWQAGGNVQVGASGTGTLNIMDSGKVSAVDLSVGAEQGGQGTVTMNGGTLELAGKLTVGDMGQGTLTVVPAAPDDEGDITSMAGSIGAALGSSGSVTIGSAVGQGLQATSSQWTVKGALVIGEAGSGILDIGGNVTDLAATIGQESTGNGTVTVENGGMWTTTNDLTVGDNGIGNLNIRTGGIAIVQFGQGVDVGSKAGSMATVDVQGQWNMTQGLTIASLGTGTMTIEGGGAVASGAGDIGLGPGSTGTVTVTGSGTGGPSTWSADGALAVGEGGTGTLNIVNGGLVLSRDGIIGKDSGGVGVVTISGAGSQWKATLTGGTGTITVGEAGTGTLNVMDGGQVISTSVVVNPNGTVNGPGGTIVADLVNNGGVISPGDATGTLVVTGNYTQNTGATLFEIDGPGPGQFDKLIISGLATLNGGAIDINFANNFLPTTGEDFDLIFALSLSKLVGVMVDVTGLPAGFVFAENFTPAGFDLFTQQTPGGAPTPEPSTWLLLASGLGSLVARRRWRRKKGSSSSH